MKIVICETKQGLGQTGAADGAEAIRRAIREEGEASIIVATGASQFEMLAALVREPDIDWSRVTVFHLDEYVGMPVSHPASFRRYLTERFVEKLPSPLRTFHGIHGDRDPKAECAHLNALISGERIAVAFVGIGENGHLAFNDPPADFETDAPYLIVDLDDACRRQQLGEGWFESLDAVPRQAISMSIRQILKSATIFCCVPDARKALAVRGALEGPITPQIPASILQTHAETTVYLDPDSAALLTRPMPAA